MFQRLEVGAGLRVLVRVQVRNVGLKRRADLRHEGVPHPGDAHPFPQLALLQGGKHESRSNGGFRMLLGAGRDKPLTFFTATLIF